jgi:hypothetical protein
MQEINLVEFVVITDIISLPNKVLWIDVMVMNHTTQWGVNPVCDTRES